MNLKSKLFSVGALCFGAFLCGAVASTVLNAQNESSTTSPSFTLPAFSFQNNLKIGDNSQEVRQLQIVLNNDVDTQISGAGVGSKDQESTYFGKLTENAVKLFQIKYKINPTGFVGASTRAELNKVASTIVETVSATASSSKFYGPLPPTKEPMPRLYTVRPQQVRKGGTVTLVGAGFQTTNTIHVGSNVFTNVFPQDGSNISFTIPATSAIQNGSYEVWVENIKGTSRTSGRPINLVVTDNPQSAPVISSVLPAAVSGTEIVTVTGVGFTPSGNDIVSGFGTIKNLPSNGMQISFSPKSLIPTEVIARIPDSKSVKVDFYVVNANGTSNIFGSVNLKP